MNNFSSFDELAYDTKRKIKSFCDYAPKTLSRIDGILASVGIEMKRHNLVFSLDVATEWLDAFTRENKFSHNTYNRYRRIILLLDENFRGVLDGWQPFPSTKQQEPSSELFKSWIEAFREYLAASCYAEKSIYVKVSFARYFLCWMESEGKRNAEELKGSVIASYCTSPHFDGRSTAGVTSEILGLKHFIHFLEEKDIVKEGTHKACLCHCNDSRHIVTICTERQMKVLCDDYEDLPTNRRNRAVYLLALKCGLRSCDIMNLRFCDIDFEKKTIRIIQQKTKVEVIVPFDTEVSNALIGYILNERRGCDFEEVFVTACGPVRRLTHNSSFRTSPRYERSEGVEMPAHDGIHILRRTFASNLLRSGVSMPMIASALGHSEIGRAHV